MHACKSVVLRQSLRCRDYELASNRGIASAWTRLGEKFIVRNDDAAISVLTLDGDVWGERRGGIALKFA